MAQEIIQLTLALIPAVAVGLALNRLPLPWEKQKRYSERAELLSLLARDIKSVKSIMARSLASVNQKNNRMPRVPLTNWQRLKKDARLYKYADEPIFKTMIKQFKEWERIGNW